MANNLLVGDKVYMNHCFEADCEENQHEWEVTAVDGDMVFLKGYGGSFKADFLYREKPKFFTPFSPYHLTYMVYDRWCGWQKETIGGWSIDEVITKLNDETKNLKRADKKAIAEKEVIIMKNTDTNKWDMCASVKLDWRRNCFVIDKRLLL